MVECSTRDRGFEPHGRHEQEEEQEFGFLHEYICHPRFVSYIQRARHQMLIYINMKFREDIINGFQVTESTYFGDDEVTREIT